MLTGKRILIVEDEPMIALDLEAAVVDAGANVLGPTACPREGLRLAQTGTVDGAIVDLRLGEGTSADIIDCLRSRKIPCIIHTGQADRATVSAWPELPVIDKPALPETLLATLSQLITAKSQD